MNKWITYIKYFYKYCKYLEIIDKRFLYYLVLGLRRNTDLINLFDNLLSKIISDSTKVIRHDEDPCERDFYVKLYACNYYALIKCGFIIDKYPKNFSISDIRALNQYVWKLSNLP